MIKIIFLASRSSLVSFPVRISKRQTKNKGTMHYIIFFKFQDGGWDGGRSNGFVNGYHDGRDNRMNGGSAFGGRGAVRNDRGGRGAYRGRGSGTYQPGQSTGVRGEVQCCEFAC